MAEHDIVISGNFDYQKITKSVDSVPNILIYEKPEDYPDKYVARVWDGITATRLVALADTLEEIRKKIPAGMKPFLHGKFEDPCIVEVWI